MIADRIKDSRPLRPRLNRLAWAAVVLIVALATAWLAAAPMLRAMGRFLDVTERPVPASYGLVLNGDAETRPFTMAALYKAGLVQQVLVTQAIDTPDTDDEIFPHEHAMIRSALIQRGVPESDIVILPGGAWSTHHEAEMLSEFLADRADATVIVVTSDFHTRRTRWTFRRVLGDRAESLQFCGAPSEHDSPDTWWYTPRGTVKYLSEYAKLVYYRMKY